MEYIEKLAGHSNKDEKMYWSQKPRVQWLKERDKKTSFFYGSVVQRRKCNRIEQLEKKERGCYRNKGEMVE